MTAKGSPGNSLQRRPTRKRPTRAELLAVLEALPESPVPLAIVGAAYGAVGVIFFRRRKPTTGELVGLNEALKDLEHAELAREAAGCLIEALEAETAASTETLTDRELRTREQFVARLVELEARHTAIVSSQVTGL